MRWWELGLISRHVGHEFSPVHLRCPYCPNHENFARLFRVEKRGEAIQEDHTSDVWECKQCSEVVFVQWHTEKGMVDYRVYPQNIRLGLESALPSDINTEYQEAVNAYLSENWDITVVLLKRLIDRMAQELEIQGKDLREVLDQLVHQGQLTQGIQDWAKKIEILNPETSSTQVATQESARELLGFVRWVLDMIYLLPHTIERYR